MQVKLNFDWVGAGLSRGRAEIGDRVARMGTEGSSLVTKDWKIVDPAFSYVWVVSGDLEGSYGRTCMFYSLGFPVRRAL